MSDFEGFEKLLKEKQKILEECKDLTKEQILERMNAANRAFNNYNRGFVDGTMMVLKGCNNLKSRIEEEIKNGKHTIAYKNGMFNVLNMLSEFLEEEKN